MQLQNSILKRPNLTKLSASNHPYDANLMSRLKMKEYQQNQGLFYQISDESRNQLLSTMQEKKVGREYRILSG